MLQPDRTYAMVIHKPPVSYYLRMAAGIKKGAMKPGRHPSITTAVVVELSWLLTLNLMAVDVRNSALYYTV